MHFLADKDRKRLLLFLSQMRMVCDSSYILDQKTRYDTKVDECVNIISDIISEEGEKVVVFSQWDFPMSGHCTIDPEIPAVLHIPAVSVCELHNHWKRYWGLCGPVPAV